MVGLRRVREELGSDLPALGTDLRDVASRHRTLRDAVAWSWRLLDRRERVALGRLSLARGGCDLDAATAILDEPPDAAATVLASLRARSFLFVTELESEPRWSMYEYIREFARASLDPDEERAARARHARHFLERGQAWSAQADREPEALERIATEIENLLAAHDFACSRDGDPDTALRLCLLVDPLFEDRGPAERRFDLVERALAASTSTKDRATRAAVFRLRARCRADRTEPELAAADLDEALATIGPRKTNALVAQLHVDRGELFFETGQLDAASRVLVTAARACERACHALGSAQCEYLRGRIEEHRGDRFLAESHYLRASELFRGLGSLRWYALLLMLTSDMQHQLLRDTWLSYAEESLRISRALGNRRLVGRSQISLASGYADRGRLDEAETFATAGLATIRAIGDRHFEGIALYIAATIAMRRGAWFAARGQLERSYELFVASSQRRWAPKALAVRSAVELVLGDVERARGSLRLARERSALVGDRTTALVLELYATNLAAADAPAPELAEAFRQRLAEPDALDQLAQSDEARLARWCVEETLVRGSNGVEEWRVMADLASFQCPGGAWITLERRRAMRRIFAALVAEHLARPGQKLSHDQLLRAGWPNEQMQRSAGINRLGFAIHGLRKLGLDRFVTTEEGGYRVAATVRVVLVDRTTLAAPKPARTEKQRAT